ncbi:MAG: lamin tail domain-containing protein [Prevotellaceae bacterium]|jgi:RHS repeat-associated protein|nr:lamin tail domain-containing protein [Prevotellaceae bacterium]
MKNLYISILFLFFATSLFAKIQPIIISEVFYDTPLEEDMIKSPNNHHNGEFIELYNPTTEDVDISGWYLRDEKGTFTVPENTVIASKAVVIIAFKHYETDFEFSDLFTNISENTQIIYNEGGMYDHGFWLNNDGEQITLYDNNNNKVDRMSYKYDSDVNNKNKTLSQYWNIYASNGRRTKNLKSIQRKNLHWTSSEIKSLQSDYYVGLATPGIADTHLLTYTIEGALYANDEIDMDLPVGTLAGTSSVSPTGAAMYNIPIEVPAGTNGFQPNLSIAYSSQGGYGALGLGWDIGGLSSISRGLQTFYFDQTADGTIDATTINFDNTDRLYIDGQRLILLTGNHFQANAIYGTETENYARVEIKTSTITNKIYFELTTKEGNVTEYGKTADALLKDGNKIMAWRMNKTKDVYENEINLTYQDNGQYLERVNYANNSIDFVYAENEETPKKRYINGFCSKQGNLLETIYIYASDVFVQGYDFAYDNSGTNAKLDVIKPFYISYSISHNYDPNGIGKVDKQYINSTKIGWGAESKIETVDLGVMPDGNINNVENAYLYTGDIDGDGYTDKIEMWAGSKDKNGQGTIRVILKNNVVLPTIKFNSYNEAWENNFNPKLVIGDINNDGKDEIILIHCSGKLAVINSPSGIHGKMYVDVYGINNNNSVIEKLRPESYDCFLVNFNSISTIAEKILMQEFDYIPLLLNMNDDEYPDLVIVPFRNELEEWDKNGIYNGVQYAIEIYYGSENGLTLPSYHQISNYCFDGWGDSAIGDFDANGIIDILRLTTHIDDHQQSKDINNKIKLRVNGSEFGNSLFIPQPLFEELYSVDIDNDGLTDILVRQGEKGSKKWFLLKNIGGVYSAPQKTTLNNLHNFWQGKGKEREGDYAVTIDYNGDGYMDLIIADEYRNKTSGAGKYEDHEKSEWYFYKNTGGGFELEKTISLKMPKEAGSEYAGISRMNPVIADINGDGVSDLVFGDRQGNKNNRHYKAFTMPAANKHNVVHSITNGLGQTEKFAYNYNNYNQEAQDLTSDVRNLKSPVMVVEKHTAIDGTATTYNFEDPKTHIKGKGFLGFQKITATNSRTKQKTVTEYEINEEYIVANLKKQTISVNNTDISETVNTNEIIKNNNIAQGKNGEKRFIPVVDFQTTTDKLRNTTSTIDYDFDDFGVLTKEETVIEDITTIKEYSNFKKRITSGLVSYLPQTMTVTKKRTNQPDYVFTSNYTYDNKGNIDIATELAGTYAETVTDYNYLPTGNLESVTVTTTDNSTPKTTNYTYDMYNRFVISKTDILGQTSYTWRDDFGRVISETDINNFTTYYEYNSTGQLTKKILPTEEEISYLLQWGVACLYKQFITSNKLNTVTETRYDNFGREFYAETTGWNGAKLKSSVEYDNLTGKVAKKTQPHYNGETEIYVEYNYNDYLQRVKEEKVFDGENILTTVYNYNDASGTVTVTPPIAEQATTSITNALGEVIERTDFGGTITYTYSTLGKPLTITANNATTTIEYDEIGRQKKLIDPNASSVEHPIEYEYFADGQLKNQKNANGDITEFIYDIAGRTDTKTVKDFDNDDNTILISTTETKYTYVESGNGKGQIQSIELKENGNIIHSQSVEYNDKHLPQSITDNFDGKTFAFLYDYDYLWRLKKTTSPSELVTTNEYNEYGDLIKIWKGEINNGIVVWEGNEQNNKGQFTKFTLGNGIITENTYNPRGELTDIQTKKDNVFIQNNHYEYSVETGNLLVRNDILNNIFETFEYDKLDRLTKIEKNDEPIKEINYFDNGNIDNKTDVGTYLYDNGKPNAVSGIDKTAVENSNVSEEKQWLTYNAFNKVTRVAQGIDEENITAQYIIYYGLNEQRIKSEYYEGETLKKTRYYLGTYELDIDENGDETDVNYISSPSGLIAIQKNENLYYVHTDRQGSLERITDTDGEIVSNYHYTPWGCKILLAGIEITDRGYTGHEHLTALGLINMNGRIYDPVLARFLSPDPYVQAPDFTQGFNRFSYGFNNPFSFIDPSGEIAWFIPVIIGAVMGGVNGAMIGHSKGATGWQMVGYIFGGAAIGAASGMAGYGLGLAGAPAWVSGGAMGLLSGGSYSALSGNNVLQGAAFGAISGVFGGFTSAAIGGGLGAFTGGAISSATNTLLNGVANKNFSWANVGISALVGGALAYGTYELTSYINYKSTGGKFGDVDITYKQYKVMQSDFMKSRTFHKEYGGYLMDDGSVIREPSRYRHNFGVDFKVPTSDILATYHTHWAKPGINVLLNSNADYPSVNDMLSDNVRQYTTERYHSDNDILYDNTYHRPSIVINRFDASYHIYGGNDVTPFNDYFMRYYWFSLFMLK